MGPGNIIIKINDHPVLFTCFYQNLPNIKLKSTIKTKIVSFYPEFGNDDRLAKQEKPVINFILDCSNSLSENNLIRLSKKLFLLMLNYMPKDCIFNVTIFGTDYHSLFPFPLANTSQTVKQATQFILDQAAANKGNTDLLNFIQKEDTLNRSLNYVLISDGHMTRPNELIAYLAEHSKSRIFTCSIGNLTNNNHLLKSIANLTKSHFNFYDEKNQSKWREKIEDLMDKIEQPAALSDIRIEWQNFDQTNIDQDTFDYNYAPKQINCLFNGRRVLAYGFMPNCQQALLRASINGYEFETVVTCPELMITKGDLIHKLTAKALIDDWQHGILCSDDKIQNDLLKQKLKDKIIKLSQKFSIVSDYTSFIAIEDRDPNEWTGEQIEMTRPLIYFPTWPTNNV
ncbi:poly [ADP-ribose] polymerase 4-like [Brachionus plicatilis]|uniref:Poly [ADP-ribose] polymerase 4-like n=1 Tax=Brachionus plicatilis TaxID=10195 RepID=A0A3M7QPX1_BRAPC|nr:poly [ADP-ribose] polymerase 4-like [Brachionus plicatilis]